MHCKVFTHYWRQAGDDIGNHEKEIAWDSRLTLSSSQAYESKEIASILEFFWGLRRDIGCCDTIGEPQARHVLCLGYSTMDPRQRLIPE
jgi:hypothetical protein